MGGGVYLQSWNLDEKQRCGNGYDMGPLNLRYDRETWSSLQHTVGSCDGSYF